MKQSCITYAQGHENKHEDTKTQSLYLNFSSCLCVFVFKIIFV